MAGGRPTALLDACVLVGPLHRNLLLSFAEAGLFRPAWSVRILCEAERAIAKLIALRGLEDAAGRAERTRQAMKRAFRDAVVICHEPAAAGLRDLPDPGDAHVIAAAVVAGAPVIVTDNIRHFPARVLEPLGIEAKTADGLLADAIELDPGPAVAAVARMRGRFRKPGFDAEALLRRMDADGLKRTAAALRRMEAPL